MSRIHRGYVFPEWPVVITGPMRQADTPKTVLDAQVRTAAYKHRTSAIDKTGPLSLTDARGSVTTGGLLERTRRFPYSMLSCLRRTA